MPLPYNAARTRLQILSDAEGECLITTHLWHLRVPNVHLKWSLTITFNCVRCGAGRSLLSRRVHIEVAKTGRE